MYIKQKFYVQRRKVQGNEKKELNLQLGTPQAVNEIMVSRSDIELVPDVRILTMYFFSLFLLGKLKLEHMLFVKKNHFYLQRFALLGQFCWSNCIKGGKTCVERYVLNEILVTKE